MKQHTKINRISESLSTGEREGNALVIVGSFAPIHDGHFDAVQAASTALLERGDTVDSLVLTPNSEEYVRNKISANRDAWSYERRIKGILSRDPHPATPTYVDDVSGPMAELRQINDYVPHTVRRHLGFTASQTVLVVGSDQLLSMQSHLENEDNRAVCVLRPGSMSQLGDHLGIPWVAKAVEAERFIITERADMENDISSTVIRNQY